mgnify:CR=1 FL=1
MVSRFPTLAGSVLSAGDPLGGGVFRVSAAGAGVLGIFDEGSASSAQSVVTDVESGVAAVRAEVPYDWDGRVVVSRTRDGGKSWEVLREGLPQEHAYDLTLRHALDVDSTGERLAFGSTTGSLWVSENGGDSWMHLSAHLPPIYAVRFA